MEREAEILISELRKLRDAQRARWKNSNVLLPGLVPKALGMIHARAAWDIEYAKKLVFDHFGYEGAATRDSAKKEIMDAVQACLMVFGDELDAFNPSAKDWKALEKIAAL